MGRGQSEVVGAVLILGIVVLLVSLAGAIFLQDAGQDATRAAPNVDIEVRVSSTNLTVVHAAGDPLERGTLVAVASADGETTRFDVDERLTFGAEWTTAHGLSAGQTVEIRVVHERSQSVVARLVTTVPDT